MLLKAHGAELVLTDGKKGMQGAIEKAEELQKTTDNSWIAGQFTNPPILTHTIIVPVLRIWEDTDGKVDIFVATVGTGGRLPDGPLSERDESVRLCGGGGTRRLTGSFRGAPGPHGIQGIGAGFIPEILDTGIYNEIITAKEEDAYRLGKVATREEGFLTGISSGAALWAAVVLGRRPEKRRETDCCGSSRYG